jgi:hypothetical protein
VAARRGKQGHVSGVPDPSRPVNAASG